MKNLQRTLVALAAATMLAGCAVGPDYKRPEVETPAAFKEGQGYWVKAAPADALERGPWWQLFQDPVLSDLASRVEVDNQNVAMAVGAYAQARALLAQQRASLFPTVTLDGGAARVGGRGTTATRAGTSYQLSIGATWEPDVWGRLRRGVEGAQAGEQASAADLQAAKLSAQGELATSYFNLRQLDTAHALQTATIASYERSLRITQNRYDAGIAARTDVLQAQTLLFNAQGDLLATEQQRATLEHAIAVLVGRAPSNFNLPAATGGAMVVPDLPMELPSTLLQRRPDIAAAERRVAQANAQIGIAQAAFYPSLTLSGNVGSAAASLSDLFSVSARAWTLGASVAQTVFDAGANQARLEGARGAHEQSSAQYRQTVLTAFQNVEDTLVAARLLRDQLVFRQQASEAADLVEQQLLNRYQAGQVSYTDVVVVQVAALNARLALAQAIANRQLAAVALIQSLGGGWHGL